MSVMQLPEQTVIKLRILQERLRVNDLDAALDKSLDLAYYVVDTVCSPSSKLLVERDGKITELANIL